MAQKWAVFISLKAKKTAQTKPYKTTLHTTESERRLPGLATLFFFFFFTLNSEDRSQTRVPLLKLTTKKQKTLFISSVRSALSKLCDALHGSVCLYRHSWHIGLASLSKSRLHRFICDDPLTLFFSFSLTLSSWHTTIIEKGQPQDHFKR